MSVRSFVKTAGHQDRSNTTNQRERFCSQIRTNMEEGHSLWAQCSILTNLLLSDLWKVCYTSFPAHQLLHWPLLHRRRYSTFHSPFITLYVCNHDIGWRCLPNAVELSVHVKTLFTKVNQKIDLLKSPINAFFNAFFLYQGLHFHPVSFSKMYRVVLGYKNSP